MVHQMQAFRDIVENHRALRRFLGALDADDDVLLEQLDWVRGWLPGHFALEEQVGGFFDALGRAGDREAVEELRSEHRELERALAALVSAHARGEPVVEALRAFGRQLEAHEAREAALGLTLEDLAQPGRRPR